MCWIHVLILLNRLNSKEEDDDEEGGGGVDNPLRSSHILDRLLPVMHQSIEDGVRLMLEDKSRRYTRKILHKVSHHFHCLRLLTSSYHSYKLSKRFRCMDTI